LADTQEKTIKDKIALIYTSGIISHTEVRGDGINPTKVHELFNNAIQDTNVKAIVLRIDSPGGDAVASDSIWRDVVRAQNAGKKVIASMGTYAASGGYYIAAPCYKIVAQPGTITGSIGVISGKFVFSKSFIETHTGVTFDEVKIGKNSDIHSPFKDFSTEQNQIFQKHLDFVYTTFINRVSSGRNISKPEVEKLANGRVYTGEEAKALKLVDEIGGLDKAIEIAKLEAGITNCKVVAYRSKNFPQISKVLPQVQQAVDSLSGRSYLPLDSINPIISYFDFIQSNYPGSSVMIPTIYDPFKTKF